MLFPISVVRAGGGIVAGGGSVAGGGGALRAQADSNPAASSAESESRAAARTPER